MSNSRIQNAKRNMAVGFINKIVTIISPFLVRTVLIYTLSVEYVGISGLFTSILQMILNLEALWWIAIVGIVLGIFCMVYGLIKYNHGIF